MHYAILVVGNSDLEEEVAPFCYGYEVEPYIKSTMKELIKFYKAIHILNTSEDKIIAEIKEYYGEENFDENNNLISTESQKAMFDYFVVGGRFCGLIEVRDGAEVKLGRKERCCDSRKEIIELVAKRRGDIAKKSNIVNLIELTNSVYGIIYEGEFYDKNDFVENILPTLNNDTLFTIIDCYD